MNELVKELGNDYYMLLIMGFILTTITICIIIAIFNISKYTKNTQDELKQIKKQNEYICQALNYMIKNDNNFRADKPQYIQTIDFGNKNNNN